jgi:glycosyltransferase involved in cell wall biosynthesis
VFTTGMPNEVEEGFKVLVVNTFAPDEPLAEILEAAKGLEGCILYVTGDLRNTALRVLGDIPSNVRLTGYLSDESYYALMAESQAVMCLTTRNHTMQRGACEALSMGKPIITSTWPLLENYFCKGTVHVDNTPRGIREGVRKMAKHNSRYSKEILQLQGAQREEWHKAVGSLVAMLSECVETRRRKEGTKTRMA